MLSLESGSIVSEVVLLSPANGTSEANLSARAPVVPHAAMRNTLNISTNSDNWSEVAGHGDPTVGFAPSDLTSR